MHGNVTTIEKERERELVLSSSTSLPLYSLSTVCAVVGKSTVHTFSTTLRTHTLAYIVQHVQWWPFLLHLLQYTWVQ